jgi:hypothetical protein
MKEAPENGKEPSHSAYANRTEYNLRHTFIQIWICRDQHTVRVEVGVPRGRGQYSRLNFHVNAHLRLVDIMRSARVFVLSLTCDVTEIKYVKVTCDA